MQRIPSTEECDADVVVLGASLLGVELVHQLRRRDPQRKLRICVVDRLARHDYIPLCHERLTRRLSKEESTLETAAYVNAQGGQYLVDEVVGLDPNTHTVRLASGTVLRGRTIVVALGSVVTPPPEPPGDIGRVDGEPSAAGPVHLRGLKFLSEVERLDALLHEGQGELPIYVVGGGISGCELAGELAIFARQRGALARGLKVTLVQRGPRLLAGLWSNVGRAALRILKRQGVEVRLETKVERSSDQSTWLIGPQGQREPIRDGIVVWSVGVSPPAVLPALNLPVDDRGWLSVGTTLQCFPDAAPSHPGIFAGGDVVQIYSAAGPLPAMRRAIEAIVQGSALARNLRELLRWNGELADYPALSPYRPLRDFPHGVSLGQRSLIVYGPICLNLLGVSVWFRRFLMRQYLARYPVPRGRGAR